jgi:hypothetical protein
MPTAAPQWEIVDLPPRSQAKPTEWEIVDLPPAAAAGAQAQAAAETEVEERSLIEGIIADVKNALGYEQSEKEKAQRALAKKQFDEQRGAGGWKDTLFSADGARLVAQGATLGAADEIEAAARSLGSETYDEALQSVRDELAAARNKPGATAIEMGAGLLVPGGAAANSVRAAPTLWNAAKHGAALGGAVGFFGSDGSNAPDAGVLDHLGERLPDAAFGASVGGIVGAAIPAAAGVGRWATGVAKARLGVGDDAYARQALADALSDEAHVTGRTTDDVLRDLEETQLPLGLAGNQSINALGHRAAETSAVARRQLTDMIADVEGGAGRRVEQAIDDAMGHETAADTAYVLQEGRRTNASRAYTDLFEQNTVHDMSSVVDMSRPSMRAAVAKANRWIADAGGLEINDPAAMTPRQIDLVGRALNDSTDRAFKAGSGEHGARLADMRDAYLRAANRELPGDRETRAMYREDSDAVRALEAGRGVNLKDSARTEEFLRDLETMDPWQRRQARIGVLQNLRDQVRNTHDAPNVLRDVAESPARAQNLADIVTPRFDEMAPELGDETRRALEALPGTIDRESRAVRGAQALRQGLPDFEGGLRGALYGIDPASLLTQPKASAAKIAYRYTVDPMNARRAALVSALLRDDWQRSLPAIRQQLSQRGVDWPAVSARWNAGFAAAGNSLSGPAPSE